VLQICDRHGIWTKYFLALTKQPMQIQHKRTDNRGKFFVQPDGEDILAELVYLQHDPTTMIVEHTNVDEELRGQNVGFQLVSSAVEYARHHHFKIVPMCAFTRAVMDKKPEFRDVLQESL
jgi:uncharacterized protein